MRTITYVVLPEDDGRKIKSVARGNMALSHRQLTRVKYAGALLLDGVPVHADAVVHTGQTVSFTLVEKEASGAGAEALPVNVLYEDRDILVIDKYAPLACQSSPKQPDNTLENRLIHRYGPSFLFRPVNRLDKGTSGLMVAAFNARAQTILTNDLHTERFVREYLAITVGRPEADAGTIDLPIAKKAGPTIVREVTPEGKPSRTHYRLLETRGPLSLLRLRLDTGRTHQIRVHLSAIGCPVYGDFMYGQEEDNLPGRFALHSTHLEIVHPDTKEPLVFDAPLPEELKRIFK